MGVSLEAEAHRLVKRNFWAAFALSVLFNAGGISLGVSLADYDYYNNGGNLTGKDVVGVSIVFVSLLFGPLAFGLQLVYLGAYRPVIGKSSASLLLLAQLLAVTVGVAYVWQDMLAPQNSWVVSPYNTDSLRQFLGGVIMLIYTGCGLAGATVLAGYWCSFRGARAAGTPPRVGEGRAIQPDELKHNWRSVAVSGAVVVASGVATCFLSPIWNYSPPSYFAALSPYSILPAGSGVIRFGPDPPPNNPQHLESPVLVVKVYEDVVVFYGVLLGLAAAGLAATYSARARRALHRRVAPGWLAALPDWLAGEWKVGVSLGEVGLVGALVGLSAYWLSFWGWRYARIPRETAGMNDPYPAAQNAARVLGHMTSLFMALSTFPASRGGALEGVFGVPFDRAVKYHRVLGRLVWLAVTAHMVVWQAKWAAEGVLWNNVFTVTNLLITGYCTPDASSPTGCDLLGLHGDNWTVPVAEASWLILTVALVFAVFSRRWSYELFHYTHHAVWLFFLSALVHAWSHWYYVVGGLTLYLIDKLSRTVRASGSATIVGARYAGGVTALTIEVSEALLNAHYAGQYVFLNVPSVDGVQWHPFTVSSPPGVVTDAGEEAVSPYGTITLHVKNMGAGTWSGRLAELAARAEDEAAAGAAFEGGDGAAGGRDAGGSAPPGLLPLSLPVSVDGPYGRMGRYYTRRSVVLLAGGIGVTPMHSVAADLVARARAPDVYGPPGAVTRVHLVWVVREGAMLGHFAESLSGLLKANPRGGTFFNLAVHVTGRAVAADALDPDAPEGTPRAYESAAEFAVHETSAAPKTPMPGALSSAASFRFSAKGGAGGNGSSSSSGEAAEPLLDGGGSEDGGPASAVAAAAAGEPGPHPVEVGLCRKAAYARLRALATPGRPDLRTLLEDIAKQTADEAAAARYGDADDEDGGAAAAAASAGGSDLSDLVSVLVCGPTAMIHEASSAAAALGLDFHSEVFHF